MCYTGAKRARPKEERQYFFFEKKKQKTFAPSLTPDAS
jgi:hypothetical protein